MDQWAATFETWEICDSFCMGFFAQSPHALAKAFEWSAHDAEFMKRAGFVIMAAYSFADKLAGNEVFAQFLPVIEREAHDGRIYVKKGVNWALRNVGKRNVDLNALAIAAAQRILTLDCKSAQWIAKDAINELTKPDAKILNYPRRRYKLK
jgi:3-methyladenine DNA glycosylase AlkD